MEDSIVQAYVTQAPAISVPFGGAVHRTVPLIMNTLAAGFNRPAIIDARDALVAFEDQLLALGLKYVPHKQKKVPEVFHFVYGLREREEFPFFAKLAVLSALHYNPGWKAIFHYHYEPYGMHWESLKPRLILNEAPVLSYFGNAPLRHYAHKADLIRMLALLNIGGAYLDIDTLVQRALSPLSKQSFVMGVQPEAPGQPGGLCNAIMLSEPNADFARLWLKQYRHFRSRGPDWLWDYLSVKTPALLARQNPEIITVLQPNAFFDPLWSTIETVMFNEQSEPNMKPLPNFAFHLWNNITGERLKKIDEDFVRGSRSLYARIARPLLAYA